MHTAALNGRWVRWGWVGGLSMLVVGPTVVAAQASRGAMGPDMRVTVLNLTRPGASPAVTQAQPGDVLEYRVRVWNRDARPVRNVVIANPIPSGVTYLPGSARMVRGSAEAEFALAPTGPFARVPLDSTKAPGGTVVVVPAPVERYAVVRWPVSVPVAPNDSVVARFQVRVLTGANPKRP